MEGSASSRPPPLEAEKPDYMLVDESDGGGESTVYAIPHQIPDSEFDGFVEQLKSTLGFGYIVTLDRAAQTITFERPSRKLMPGPALDNNGLPQFFTYNVPFPREQATKLKNAWQNIEFTLYGYSISCHLNLASCSMQVSTTTSLKDPCMVVKARKLLQLLSTTPVPLFMAFEIFKGVRQQVTINIGFQEGGICSNFGIKKDDYLKRWESLCCSLKALSKATCCHIFLDGNTCTAVTAVGSSVDKLPQLKAVVEECITNNVCPLTSIRRFETEVLHESMDEPHAKHKHSLKCVPLSTEDGMHEVCSLYASLHENRVSKLQDSLAMLESFLRSCGISYTLDTNSFVLSAIRGTKEPYIIDRAWKLFELLSTTHVPVSMAVELLNGRHTCLVKIGNQEGGLSSLHQIKEEEYSERWECIRHSLEILAETLRCNVFLNDTTVAAVGKEAEMVNQLVENCILYGVCPGTAAWNYKLLLQRMKSIEDPHKQHVEMENSGSAMMIMPEVSSLCTFFIPVFNGEQVTLLGKNFKGVEACLKKYGFCCKLITEDKWCYMIVSKTMNTQDPDITSKIWDFLKLLSTNVEPSKAIEALNGSLHYDFIPTGYKYGKFCSKAGITEKQFDDVVWPRIELGLEEISSQLELEYFISPQFTTVVGDTNVKVLREFVLRCFRLRMPAIPMGIIDG